MKKNPNGLWRFGEFDYENMSADQIQLKVDQLVAKTIQLRTAHEYTPELGNYDMETEGSDKFYRAWKERSDREDASWPTRVAQEQLLDPTNPEDAELIKQRKSSGGTLASNPRRILDRNIDPRSNTQAGGEYNATMALKGPGAFRPLMANVAFDEVGSLGMTKLAFNLQRESVLSDEALDLPQIEEDVNNIIPSDSAGFASSWNTQDTPFIPEASVNPVDDLMQGLDDNRLAKKKTWWKNELHQYAHERGLNSLVEQGNYGRLHAMYLAEKYGVDPYLNKIGGAVQNEQNASEGIRNARAEYFEELFNQVKFVHDAADVEVSVLQIAESLNFKPEDLRDGEGSPLSYLMLLDYLRKKKESLNFLL